MGTSIVCGVDNSATARRALRLGAALSEQLGLRLVLVHVTPMPTMAVSSPTALSRLFGERERSAALEAGRQFLERVAIQEQLDDASIRSEFGDPAERIASVAEEERAEFIALGSRGRGPVRAALLGSVSGALASRATCPILIVSGAPSDPQSLDTIVCGVDESEGAGRALAVAARLSRRLRARLVIAHAAPMPLVPAASTHPGTLDRLRRLELQEGRNLLAERAREHGLEEDVDVRVVFGSPAGALGDVADEEGAALLVVGSRGHGAARSALLGSVSRELSGRAPCPVVIVPHDRSRAPGSSSNADAA